jgi:hypothetical protein
VAPVEPRRPRRPLIVTPASSPGKGPSWNDLEAAVASVLSKKGLAREDIENEATLEPERGRWTSAAKAHDLRAAQAALQPYLDKIARLSVDKQLVDAKLRRLDALLRQSASRLALEQYNPLQTSYLDLQVHLAEARGSADFERLAKDANALEKKLRAALRHSD